MQLCTHMQLRLSEQYGVLSDFDTSFLPVNQAFCTWKRRDLLGKSHPDQETSTLLRNHKGRSNVLLPSEKKKAYKANLSFWKELETKYSWATCKDPTDGMFCSVCQKWEKPLAWSRGAWTTRGVVDWNHDTGLLKQHANSQWHRDSAVVSAMAHQS